MTSYGAGPYGAGLYPGMVVETPPFPALGRVRPGNYAVETVLWRADRYGNRIDRVATRNPITGIVQFNEDNEFKRQFSLSVNDPDAFPGLRTWIIPEVTLVDAQAQIQMMTLGHYLLVPGSSHTTSGRRTGAIEGKDVTFLLANAETDGISFPVGTDCGAAARSIALAAGLSASQVVIPDIGVTLAEAAFFDPGTSYLSIVNKLLNAANWYAIWTDDLGRIRTRHWSDLQTQVPTVTYGTGDGVELVPPADEDPEWDKLRNKIYVVNPKNDQRPAIWGKAEITNPTHPLYAGESENGIGFQRSETIIDNEVPDDATAQLRAEAILSQRSSYYRKIRVRTLLDVTAGAHDVVNLDLRMGEAQIYSGSWWRRAWTVRLQGVTAVMDSELLRVERWR